MPRRNQNRPRMAVRRRRRGGRNRPRTEVLNYSFSGWTIKDSKVINAESLGLITNRPCVVRSVSFQFSSSANTSTYMIPSNLTAVTLTVLSANGEVVALSGPRLIPFGPCCRLTIRVPANTDFGVYGPGSPVVKMLLTSHNSYVTISYCGTARVHYTRNNFALQVAEILDSDSDSNSAPASDLVMMDG